MKKLLLILIVLFPILATAQNGQSVVKLKNGTVLKGIIKHIDPTDALTIDVAGVETQIKMSDIAEVEALKDERSQEDETQQTIVKRRPVAGDPLSQFKGFLLAKGNNVYVYSEDGHLGAAGASELKRLLKADGFWNVVEDINQAHFVLKYYVNLEGRDKAHIIAMTPKGDSKLELGSTGSSESVSENREVARNLYLAHLMPLYKKIETKKYPKSFNEFIK